MWWKQLRAPALSFRGGVEAPTDHCAGGSGAQRLVFPRGSGAVVSHLALETKRGRGEGVAQGVGSGGGQKRGLKLELWDEVRFGKRKQVTTWGGSPERESHGDAALWLSDGCGGLGESPALLQQRQSCHSDRTEGESSRHCDLLHFYREEGWAAAGGMELAGVGQRGRQPPNREAKYLRQGSDWFRFAASGVKKRTGNVFSVGNRS